MPSQFGGILDEEVPKSQFGGVLDVPENKAISPVLDTAKSVGFNLVGGAIDTAMVLPNLINQVAAGPQLLGRGVADTLSPMLGVTPQPRGEVWKPFYDSSYVEKKIGTDYQPETTAGKVAALPSRLIGGIGSAIGLQKAAPKIDAMFQKKPPQVTSEEKFATAAASYKDAESQGATLYPNSTNKFVDMAEQVMPQTEAGKLVAGETPSTKLIQRLGNLRNKHLDLKSAQEIDGALADAMSGETNAVTGKLTAEGTKIYKIQQALRSTIENASEKDLVGGTKGFEAWKAARQQWADAAKMRDIEGIIQRAEMLDNPVTGLKTGFRNLAMNIRKGKTKGYSPQEIDAINKAAHTGIGTDILRLAGSRLGPIAAGAAGLASGGPLGAAAGFGTDYAISGMARSAANKMQMGRANKVLGMVANRGQAPAAPLPNKFPSNYNPVMTPAAVGFSLGDLMAMSPAEARRILEGNRQ